MKILQVCFRVPFPLKDGGAIAMFQMATGFVKNGAEVDMLAFNTTKHFVDKPPSEISSISKLFTVNIDNTVSPIGAFLNLFSNKSYHIQRFESKKFEQKILSLLSNNNYDVVQFEGIYPAIYLEIVKKHYPNLICVYRAHNVENLIWERSACESNGLKSWYLKLLARRLKRFEDSLIPLFDLIVPITEIDEQYFINNGARQTFVSQTGIEISQYEIEVQKKEKSVFHLGSMDWLPNQQAIEWMVKEVWPLVVKEISHAKLYLAGRHFSDNWLKEYEDDNLSIIGEVDDAKLFMCEHEVMVVPLKAGSGMRIKAVEGLAAGLPIVSTKVGVEGIEITNGQDFLQAESEKEFAQAIIKLLEDKELRLKLSENAKNIAIKKYSNQAIVKRLLEKYKSMVN